MNTSPSPEPPVYHRDLGNYDATCRGYLVMHRAAPLSLLSDLARLDERLREAGDTRVPPHARGAAIDRAQQLVATLLAEARDMPELSGDDECGFEGKVDAEYYRSNQTVVWTCPRCGNEATDDVSELD